MPSEQLVVSLPTDRLQLAARIDAGIELKLNWEDYDVLSGDRGLLDLLAAADVAPDRLASVHLSPGLRTRGREIGMAATRENVGAITDFVQEQLRDVPDPFLVLHTPRKFEYDDHLSLLATLCELLDHDVAIENPPGTSYWSTPEQLAFFGFVGATGDDWDDLYLTVDSAHLPQPRREPDRIDEEVVETLFDRVARSAKGDASTVREAYLEYLRGNVESFGPSGAPRRPEGGWMALLNALVLAGDRVKSVHFNDPEDDGTPDLTHQRDRFALASIREILRSEEIYVVLEPDEEEYERPRALRRRVEEIDAWLS